MKTYYSKQDLHFTLQGKQTCRYAATSAYFGTLNKIMTNLPRYIQINEQVLT